jgi:G3E family GTPase
MSEEKVPVTILTGYLGSGKTTFVNYLLKADHGHKFAIIENEFGEVGIDDGLVLQSNEEIIEMMNGCICCTVREDLIVTIKKLCKSRKGKFNHIIIETTGLADPAPVAQTFFVDEDMQKMCRLDAIVTFIDCKFTGQHLDEEKPEGVENEAHEQVAFADVLVLNKTDLVTSDELETIKEKLKAVNVHAPMIEAQYSKVPIDKVINVKAFDLEKTIAMDEGFLDTDAEHQHDSSISSFGIHIEGVFRPGPLNEWLSKLMQEKGADLYRSKGILAIEGSDEKYVFQAVHMMMNMGSSSELGMSHAPWGESEKRINKFCFIGKNLNKEEMIAELEKCISDGKPPEPGPVPTDTLTYAVGDRVQCNCGDWEVGTVQSHWYRERLWETGRYAPYQVLLDNGDLIHVPRDSAVFIKPATNKKAKTE